MSADAGVMYDAESEALRKYDDYFASRTEGECIDASYSSVGIQPDSQILSERECLRAYDRYRREDRPSFLSHL